MPFTFEDMQALRQTVEPSDPLFQETLEHVGTYDGVVRAFRYQLEPDYFCVILQREGWFEFEFHQGSNDCPATLQAAEACLFDDYVCKIMNAA